jgi:hypothetical protein
VPEAWAAYGEAIGLGLGLGIIIAVFKAMRPG